MPCGLHDCGCGRKSRAFGVVTWIALVFAVCIVGGALWLALGTTKGDGTPIILESGEVWFPEPAFILEHEKELELSVDQRRHVQAVDREWRLKRAAYEAQFKSLKTDADAVLDDLKAGRKLTGAYGKAVEEFDTARGKAWNEAKRRLHPKQIDLVEKLRSSSSKGHALRMDPTWERYTRSLTPPQDPVLVDLESKINKTRSDLSAMGTKFKEDSPQV